MGNLPSYSSEIRQKAVELIEEKNPDGSRKYSYSQIIQKLKEEYPDIKLSKSTLTRWYRQYQKKTAKEKPLEPKEEPEEKLNEEPKPEPKPPKDSIEEVNSNIEKLPQITPDGIVKELNESITEVPEGPLMQEEVDTEEKEEEKDTVHKIADKLVEHRSKILWSITLSFIVGVIIYFIYKRFIKKTTTEMYVPPEVRGQPQPHESQPYEEEMQKYKRITSPNQYDQPGSDEFISSEVLP